MKKFEPKNDLPMMSTKEGVVLFHPHIPKNAISNVTDTLSSRWIGQGPKVDAFEEKFKQKFHQIGTCHAVGSGTDALHLAYILAGISEGDEVLTPLFTCTATNIPLLYLGATPVFVDINPQTMNISIDDLKRKITPKTKAIVCVHYGGLPCDMAEIHELAEEYQIPVIEDAAHAVGAKYDGKNIGAISQYTMYSFQAIKHITTGDGGMLTISDPEKSDKANRIRWFGIDRKGKQGGIWENDIREIGYKYQMTDISAAMGLAALDEFDDVLSHRQELYALYKDLLKNNANVMVVDDNHIKKEHAAWLFTIRVKNRLALQDKLRANGIESGQTHYRNDRYSIFSPQGPFPGMDEVDDQYLVLPLHTKVSSDNVLKICKLINEGW